MLVDNSHTLYIINHSILFLITIHTVTHQHSVSPSFMSLPTVPQYSQISHCFFFYFFPILTRYPFIISYSSIPSFKSLIAPLHLLHIKCIQRMWTRWAQHFQRPRFYHNYIYYHNYIPGSGRTFTTYPGRDVLLRHTRFPILTRYPFIISYSSIPSFKSLIAPLHLLHIKCIQRMWTRWAQHFQRPRFYHNYIYYPYSYPDWAPRNRFA